MVAEYEEVRRKRIEENKKRMDALNLHHLSHKLKKKPSFSPRPSPARPRTPQQPKVAVRRSSRVANLPAPVYKEVVFDRVTVPRTRTRRSYNRHKDYSMRVYASDEAREEALEKAYKLESDLGSNYPIFVKTMLQSHVSGGFWLGLPSYFCNRNLPRGDEVINLIDEDGNEYPTNYLPRKTGLSGGWKAFACAHELADGDALVFQLVKPSAFKVYIIRVNGPAEEG